MFFITALFNIAYYDLHKIIYIKTIINHYTHYMHEIMHIMTIFDFGVYS